MASYGPTVTTARSFVITSNTAYTMADSFIAYPQPGVDKLFSLSRYEYIVYAYKPDSREPVEGSVTYAELQAFDESLRDWFEAKHPELRAFIPAFPKVQ